MNTINLSTEDFNEICETVNGRSYSTRHNIHKKYFSEELLNQYVESYKPKRTYLTRKAKQNHLTRNIIKDFYNSHVNDIINLFETMRKNDAADRAWMK